MADKRAAKKKAAMKFSKARERPETKPTDVKSEGEKMDSKAEVDDQKLDLKKKRDESGQNIKTDKDSLNETPDEKLNFLDEKAPKDINFKQAVQGKNEKRSQKQNVPKRKVKEQKAKTERTKSKDKASSGKSSSEPDKNQALNKHSHHAKNFVETAVVTTAGMKLHHEMSKAEEDNASVEGVHQTERVVEHSVRASRRRRKRKSNKSDQSIRTVSSKSRSEKQQIKDGFSVYDSKENEKVNRNNEKPSVYYTKTSKQFQKKKIKQEYAKAKRNEHKGFSVVSGLNEYKEKAKDKIKEVFVSNKSVIMKAVAVIFALLFLMTSITSCVAVVTQNVFTYAATSYLSDDEDIRKAELYYTSLEADLQKKINDMESSASGYDEYNYNIDPIEHDPFTLISYLSAKYEVFTFDDEVKAEIKKLFNKQYRLTTENTKRDDVTVSKVKVGQSLGKVVTSGYCNCVLCCGKWAGGNTASGVKPKANHTIAVDAKNPKVPMGTKVIMNGIEYKVEDTGAFAKYGVDFDVYYSSHSAAQNHGHKTWDAYISDANGKKEIEVKTVSEKSVMNITLKNNNFESFCRNRLIFFKRDLFDCYQETKGNLQMFATPTEYNWYDAIYSYYGYRINESNKKELHNGLDIALPVNDKIYAGMTGKVTHSGHNSDYGNYVIITNAKGYEIRYAKLKNRNVSAGDTVESGQQIGTCGSNGYIHIELLFNGERTNPIFYFETGTKKVTYAVGTTPGAQKLINFAKKFLGTPYVWGGYSPSGFDCSGYVSYCLTKSGAKNTGRKTAQELYNSMKHISKSEARPGDLIFFKGTYNAGTTVTHVGIYLGEGKMIHCGHPCQISNINTAYWQSHFYAFGRW